MREPKHFTDIEMRTLLREAYARDPESSFIGQLARGLCDPAMPRDAKQPPRIHPLWLRLGLIAGFIAAVLIYFSFLRP